MLRKGRGEEEKNQQAKKQETDKVSVLVNVYGRSRTRFKGDNLEEYEKKISNMRQHLKCGDKNCRGINVVSAKWCFYCQNKLKNECLPRTASVIKAKLRIVANGGDRDNNGIRFHSVLCMVPYEVEDQNTYIFMRDGIPSENDVKKMYDIAEKVQMCIYDEDGKNRGEVLG